MFVFCFLEAAVKKKKLVQVMPCGRWEGHGALLMWEAKTSLLKLLGRLKIWIWPWVWGPGLDLCVHGTLQQECITSWTGECAVWRKGIWSKAAKIPGFHEVWVPMGALCCLLQDLQTRPCHHNSSLQMRKLCMNWKQVKSNTRSLPVGLGDPARHKALPFHCIPGAFPHRAHELPWVAW